MLSADTPSPAYNYQLNCGQYVLHYGDTPVGRVQDAVALAVDLDGARLRKYGDEPTVTAWAMAERARMRALGGDWVELADRLVVLIGRFPLGELNRCVANPEYAGVLYQKLRNEELSEEPLF